jgi:serine/threonine protein kinase
VRYTTIYESRNNFTTKVNYPIKNTHAFINIRYDKCVDYWALGILTYELLTSETPFNGENDEELFEAILKNPIHFKSTLFSAIAISFVQGLLTRNPDERLGCKKNNSLDIRNHVWVQQSLYSFEQLEQQSIPAVYIPSNLVDYTNYPLKFIEVIPLKNSINEKLFENF